LKKDGRVNQNEERYQIMDIVGYIMDLIMFYPRKLLAILAVLSLVFIYLLGIGACSREMVYEPDPECPWIGSLHYETILHPFELTGENGGLPIFLSLVWFVVLLMTVSGLWQSVLGQSTFYTSGLILWIALLFVLGWLINLVG